MRVQTDRYNWSVPVPLDSDYAIGLLIAAVVLVLAAGYYSGVKRQAPQLIRSRPFMQSLVQRRVAESKDSG